MNPAEEPVVDHENDPFNSRSLNHFGPQNNGKVSSGPNKIIARDSTSHGVPIHSDSAYSASSYGSYLPPAPAYSAPAPSYSAPAHTYSAPAPSYSAPSYSAPPPAYTVPDAYIPATSYEELEEADPPAGALKKKILVTLAALITLVAVLAPFAVIGIITLLLRLGFKTGLSTLFLRRSCATNTFQLFFGPLCAQLKNDLYNKRAFDPSGILPDLPDLHNFPKLMEIINSVRFTVMDHLESLAHHSD